MDPGSGAGVTKGRGAGVAEPAGAGYGPERDVRMREPHSTGLS